MLDAPGGEVGRQVCSGACSADFAGIPRAVRRLDHRADEPDRPQATPVFAGQELVVVGGSSGMGRQIAAEVVAAGGGAVIIGQDPGTVGDTVETPAKEG